MRTIALPLCFMLGAAACAGEPNNPHVWAPQVRSVAVFKNGLGFFVADGEVTLRDGWCVAAAAPPALFGTLGIYADAESQAVDLVGGGVGETFDFEAAAPLPEKADRLRGLLNLDVALTTEREDVRQERRGKLTEVAEGYAIVKSEGTLIAFPLGELVKVQVLEYPLRIHVDGAQPDARTRLGMGYLRTGITWIPEYTLRIIDEQTAELTLRATLVNEVDDLTDCDVHFVVGVPSFLHAEFLSPLAVGQTIRVVAAALPEGVKTQMLSNAIMNRAATAADQRTGAQPDGHAGGNVDSFLGGLPQLDSAGASDFTVYTRKALSVRRGEKAVVTVFTRKVAYRHAYRWESPGTLRHLLQLANDTDTAWTTGPVVAVSGPQPLCEDLLKYTPRGGTCDLPVTTAVNVATDARESEVDRKLKAHEPMHNVFFDLVTVEGRLVIRNHEQRPVTLQVERRVPGLLTTVSDGGRFRQDTDKLKLLERSGAASWTVELPTGGERVLTYRYERYVESR